MTRLRHRLTGSEGRYRYEIELTGNFAEATAVAVLHGYFRFMRRISLGLIRTRRAPGGTAEMSLCGVPLLILRALDESPSEARYAIVGGLLAAGPESGELVVAAQPGGRAFNFAYYRPRLSTIPVVGPLVYRLTQAPVHLAVTALFLRSLPEA